MIRSPNPRLQRTPSAPLSRQPLGASARLATFAGVFAALGINACSTSGLSRYCCPQPENRLQVCVRTPLENPSSPGLLTGIRATVVLREVDGTVLFRGDTDETGRLVLAIDYRAIRLGQRLEAFAAGGRLEAAESLQPGVRAWQLVVTPGGGSFVEVTDVYQCP
jgi:hypothetical protein